MTFEPSPAVESVPCAVCGAEDVLVARIRTPRDAEAFQPEGASGRSRWGICNGCGLVYQTPRPTRAAVEDLYVDGTYHEQRGGVPESYIDYSLRRSDRALRWALSLPGVNARGRSLDVGCGVGGALVNMRERGGEVFGVEPDPQLSAVARDRFGLAVTTSLLEADTLEAHGDFDFAYSCHVWEHLLDPIDTTSHVARALEARRGVFCVVVPTYRRPRTWVWRNFSTPHTYLFDHRSLSNVMRLAGLDPIAYHYAAGEDSEVWVAARAGVAPVAVDAIDRQDPHEVQRALMRAPLAAPLGVPARAVTHTRTLRDDPRDFADRLQRWARARGERAVTSLRR